MGRVFAVLAAVVFGAAAILNHFALLYDGLTFLALAHAL